MKMNTIRRMPLLGAMLASLAIVAIPANAAESRGELYADASDDTAMVVCNTSTNGKVPKQKLVKALHRMLDMGDTPAAAKMTKDDKRKMQFDIFWKELSTEGG
jgi:hypothetical protein